MQGYPAAKLEEALCRLWALVEGRLADEDRKALGIDVGSPHITNVFEELHCCGAGGVCGIGLGRPGGHAVG
jgi:hypothetical protein